MSAAASRLWWLHVRARGIGFGAVALVFVALAAWGAGYALAHPDLAPNSPGGVLPSAGIDGLAGYFEPTRRVPVIAGGALLAILIFSGGLAGADPELERATPTRWWCWRAAHLAGIVLVAGALLAITVIPAATTFGAAAMARNVIGYVGLTALSATVLGASLAWAPPLVYGATVYLAAPHPPNIPDAAQWWAWPMQPGGWDASWMCAIALCAIGSAAYIRFGARR